MTRIAVWGAALCALAACDDGSPPPGSDAEIDVDGGPVAQCARHEDCGGTYCEARECRPGEADADARGCVAAGAPCDDDEVCDAVSETCSPAACTVEDEDGDGEASFACLGQDCDDTDGTRRPGLEETCDAGHDEDCDPSTLAGDDDGDLDGDGFVSAACCNGSTCGEDCDDTLREVFPGARELCNGEDDDCDGDVDEEPDVGSLCPGGTCDDGRCELRAWDRTFGDAQFDSAAGVVMDPEGNVYLTGHYQTSADVGGETLSSTSRALFVVAYAPGGALRWARSYQGGEGRDIDYDASNHSVSVISIGSADFGEDGSAPSAFVLSLDADDGAYRWHYGLPDNYRSDQPFRITARDGLVVAASTLNEDWDFGAGTRSAPGFYLVALDGADGALSWDRVLSDTFSHYIRITSMALGAGGALYVGGHFNGTVDLGLGSTTSDGGNADGFVAALAPGGATTSWVYPLPIDSYPRVWDLVVTEGSVLATGVAWGEVDFGGGTRGSSSLGTGYVLRLGLDGSYQDDRIFQTTVEAEAHGIALTPSGNVVIAGSFMGTVNLGSGSRPVREGTTREIFVAEYTADLDHVADTTLGTAREHYVTGLAVGRAGSTAISGNFMGTADFGTGPRISVSDSTDAFVTRLAN